MYKQRPIKNYYLSETVIFTALRIRTRLAKENSCNNYSLNFSLKSKDNEQKPPIYLKKQQGIPLLVGPVSKYPNLMRDYSLGTI